MCHHINRPAAQHHDELPGKSIALRNSKGVRRERAGERSWGAARPRGLAKAAATPQRRSIYYSRQATPPVHRRVREQAPTDRQSARATSAGREDYEANRRYGRTGVQEKDCTTCNLASWQTSAGATKQHLLQPASNPPSTGGCASRLRPADKAHALSQQIGRTTRPAGATGVPGEGTARHADLDLGRLAPASHNTSQRSTTLRTSTRSKRRSQK